MEYITVSYRTFIQVEHAKLETNERQLVYATDIYIYI